ncbi:MAG: electron transporter RnfD [Salinivirgaceae bacterium]|nr:MAG: electron transporter RnfD [Salinivirgaceae bacterium]
MRIILITTAIIGLVISMCSNNKFISPDSDLIYYQGRIDTTEKTFYDIFWPGTSMAIKVNKGTVKVLLSDDIGQSYYNVIIDGKHDTIIRPQKEKESFIIASNLSEGEHTIEVFRRTEYTTGTTRFYGFELSEGANPIPIEKRKIQMVCIGNSITTGYANENPYGNDRPDSIFTNNYLAYGAIAARQLNADYQCIARGGIGFMVSWHEVIMPEIFNLTNPNNSSILWNPQTYDQRIVVVNLGQNDSWIIPNPGFTEYKLRFGDKIVEEKDIEEAYMQFIKEVRSYYPNSYIICALGSMDAVQEDSPWFGYIENVVNKLKDPKISTLKFPFLAVKTHPTISDHKQMAGLLIDHIKQNMLR